MWVVGLGFPAILHGVVQARCRLVIYRLIWLELSIIRRVHVMKLPEDVIVIKEMSRDVDQRTHFAELFVQTMYSTSSLYGFKNA